MHERFLLTVDRRILDRITRAQHTGELVADVDLEFAAEVLCGTLYYRQLLPTRLIDEGTVNDLLNMLMSPPRILWGAKSRPWWAPARVAPGRRSRAVRHPRPDFAADRPASLEGIHC